MSEWIEINKDTKHVTLERSKARELRKTQWWKKKLSEGICYYCKKKSPVEELTMDHIVPVARGGKSSKGNCVVCCKTCNNKKTFMTPVEMILNDIKEKK